MRPDDSVVVHIELNPVVGGAFRIDTRAKDGRIHAHSGHYVEIQRPHKLSFTWNSTVLGDHSSQVTVEFHQEAENCLMVLTHELPPDEEILRAHEAGWTGILDLLVQQQNSKAG